MKEQGTRFEPWLLCSKAHLLSSTSHFTKICFHMEKSQSVGSCLPQALSAPDRDVFILLTQKHSQILTKAGNLLGSSQLDVEIIIFTIH